MKLELLYEQSLIDFGRKEVLRFGPATFEECEAWLKIVKSPQPTGEQSGPSTQDIQFLARW